MRKPRSGCAPRCRRASALSAVAEDVAHFGKYFLCHAGVRPGVPLERQDDHDLLWIRGDFLNSTMDFGKIVVHGHTPVAEPEVLPNRINVDTGAFASGRLTCVALDDRRPPLPASLSPCCTPHCAR